jgi:hemerythrin-like domain-containing protein
MESVERASAFGDTLVKVHDFLRRSLHGLRAELAEPSRSSSLSAMPGYSLQAYCVGFCAAVTGHHTREDDVAFPLLAQQVPELAPVLLELQCDHVLIASILKRVEELAESVEKKGTAAVLAELDGLAAVLESHFRWEERRVGAALDGLVTREHFQPPIV